MTSVTPDRTSSQYEVTEPQAKIESLVEEVKPETELDLEFLYTRDIEFRQETIYFFEFPESCLGLVSQLP